MATMPDPTDEYVASLVASAPKPTAEQMAQLSALFAPALAEVDSTATPAHRRASRTAERRAA